MSTFSDVLSDWRYFDIVRFAEIVFRNPVSRYRRLNVREKFWELDFYYRRRYLSSDPTTFRLPSRSFVLHGGGSAVSPPGHTGSFGPLGKNTESEAL
ncbi:hypothetical protein OUZ56_016693 [Daphnia magna]|uniref:Uncharacterized protein n=1 Tax=Daphnia magna TaxID=35525 RepID=A0ABR0ARA1_9CRUS|nr:hypothetical protein OUZ56_016693 [Daphnia magna]